ncbi:MAG: ABC transporter substrate-binding protein [Clostridia bacterium]|jgi:iron complex transport system substrate-binding protein|nr:ABC transporter substrate-binding protein [Clostridia bacterium]
MKSRSKRILIIVVCVSILFALGSCNSAVNQEGQSEIIDEFTFIDDVGAKFTIEKPYERIVSLYSAHTENLFTLGAGEKVIGVNTASIYPPDAAFLPMYDYREGPEALIAAAPDLVIVRPFINRNYPDYIKALKSAGLTVVSLYPESSSDFERYIMILAMLTGTQDNATRELALLAERLEAIADKTGDIEDKLTVFFEATKSSYRTVTVDSNPAMAIQIAGGINIADDVVAIETGSTIAEYGIEKLMLMADEIDVYISQRGAMNSGGSIVSIPQREGFHAIKAVQEMRILELNEKIISSPTFRYYKGVSEIARMLYPDVMDDYSVYKSDEALTRESYAAITVMFSHTPIFIPSSSHYYEREYYNHTYGLLEDVEWNDDNFDFIETAVMSGFMRSYENEDGSEYFDKDGLVTRADLALTLYIMGDYQTSAKNTDIIDIADCENEAIIQKVVDNGIMFVDSDGYFYPNQTVSANEAIEILERLEGNL